MGTILWSSPIFLHPWVFLAWFPFYFTPILCQTTSWMSRPLLPVNTGERSKLGCVLKPINLCCLHVQLFWKQFQVSRLAIYNFSDAFLCLIQQMEANAFYLKCVSNNEAQSFKTTVNELPLKWILEFLRWTQATKNHFRNGLMALGSRQAEPWKVKG